MIVTAFKMTSVAVKFDTETLKVISQETESEDDQAPTVFYALNGDQATTLRRGTPEYNEALAAWEKI